MWFSLVILADQLPYGFIIQGEIYKKTMKSDLNYDKSDLFHSIIILALARFFTWVNIWS